ncbi:hypothetical protein [Methylocella sp.]|uniref:hypothetical protein n=1 Tax=Methylocella sp. TaxID=1978226 RepID=UPI0037847648
MQHALQSPPFQVYAFFGAFVLVLLVNATGVVSKVITLYTNIFAHEFISSRNHLFLRLKDKVELSAAVGVVEQTLYLYALFSGLTGILTSVLIFKAFNGWLTIAAPTGADLQTPNAQTPTILPQTAQTQTIPPQTIPPQTAQPAEGHVALENLIRFYGYAIGNFISLMFAIVIFEATKYAFQHVGALQPYWL